MLIFINFIKAFTFDGKRNGTFIIEFWIGVQIEKVDIPIFETLVLPRKTVEDETTPTPQMKRISTYPDPTMTDVFWILSLILKLGNEVSPKNFERYLHGEAV